MRFTAQLSIKGKDHPTIFEFKAKDDLAAIKLVKDYCAFLGNRFPGIDVSVTSIDVRRERDGTPFHCSLNQP